MTPWVDFGGCRKIVDFLPSRRVGHKPEELNQVVSRKDFRPTRCWTRANEAPHPTQAPPASLSVDLESVGKQAQWAGEKAATWDEDWVVESHRRGVDIKKWLCRESDDSDVLW